MSKKEPGKAYTKQQHLASRNYTVGQKDLLNALLEDDKTYTHAQVEGAIKEFLKKEAK